VGPRPRKVGGKDLKKARILKKLLTGGGEEILEQGGGRLARSQVSNAQAQLKEESEIEDHLAAIEENSRQPSTGNGPRSATTGALVARLEEEFRSIERGGIDTFILKRQRHR